MTRIPRALTIAGSDSGGGAGIQADIKTFEAFGVFGMSAVTAITAQNTREVCSIQEIDPKMIADQIDAVCEDIGADIGKTGMLANSAIIEIVARKIRQHKIPVVVDPVMVAKSGAPLASQEAIRTMKKRLLPDAVLLTPNTEEAEILAGCLIQTHREAKMAARKLAQKTPAVLLKGGHLAGGTIVDWLILDGKIHEFAKKRIVTKNTHGTGCSLAAAVAANLALGFSLLEAVRCAEVFIDRAIRWSLPLGNGHGPVNHFVEFKNESNRWRVLKEIREAIDLFEKENIAGLIPEVGSNFAVALPFAQTLEEVAGVEGRMVKTASGVKAAGGPCFGASNHVARLLLGIREHDPTIQAAMNIRYTQETVAVCKKLGLRIATFNRGREPRAQKNLEGRTLAWAAHKIIKNHLAPDVVIDQGALGKEPMIRLLSKNPQQLRRTILNIHRELKALLNREQ
ncbi:MAG: bifunctional hydroxymethylpyrimidine kinase/phosphomethylpyrimidine kinase [Elusimicrobia bacterium]|nr:bifunctional hydroxymethylpyrimidine kinase/phosphomethylpyrimidine kinase [Elusimicrobiota bacterium]